MNREIIDFIKDYPILWDKSHIDYYRNIPTKNEIWSLLASKLGMHKDHVKRRWNSMRDQHYKALKDNKNPNRNGRTTNYKYGKFLNFLNGNVSPNYTNDVQHNTYDNEKIVNGEGFTWEILDQSGDDQLMKIETDSTIDCINDRPANDTERSQASISQTPLMAEEEIKIEDVHSLSWTPEDDTDLETQNQKSESFHIEDKNSPVMLFMMSLAAQIESANLSPKSFINLQIKLLQAVRDEID